MCGIFFSISTVRFVPPDEETLQKLQARGPDSCQTHKITADPQAFLDDPNRKGAKTCFLTFVATVLALRGEQVQRQPMIDQQTQSVFCWNGEAWKVDGHVLSGNDTSHIFQILLAAAKSSPRDACKRIVAVLSSISGPFAFVFYDALSSCLYYSRDWLGRRSLMKTACSEEALVLSSVSPNIPNATFEVEMNGIHRVSLRTSITSPPELLPWESATPIINQDLPLTAAGPSSIAHSTVRDVKRELLASLHLRVADIPQYTPNRTLDDPDQGAAKVAVLFSGGLDCTLLVRLAHDLLPAGESIDLLNVAFYNPRTIEADPSQALHPFEACPDRITGRSSFHEIRLLCPTRKWRFVAINIPYEEVVEHRSTIVELMQPHKTEMDLSIAMALYFAARGRGFVERPPTLAVPSGSVQTDFHQSTARVLISGLGADELFAGYSRHSTVFARRGYDGLVRELELDFQRIGKRNLGRDDRVTSHWGKEVRYPFLDDDFVRFSLGLEVWQKCGFRPKELGEVAQDVGPSKMLLRLLALELGLQGAAREKKRAIQFGARTAKMEIGKGRRRGTDVVERSAAMMMETHLAK